MAIQKINLPEELNTRQRELPAIGVANGISATETIRFMSEYAINHVVQRTENTYQNEMMTAEIMATNLETYLNFPVSTILNPKQTNQHVDQALTLYECVFNKADEKVNILNGFQLALSKRRISSTLVSDILLVADELFTNAIYNAPHVSFDKNATGAPRTKAYGNAKGIRPARIFLASDDDRLLVGCEDSYGSLNPDKLIERLYRYYERGGHSTINFGEGGAGLGTFMIFRSTSAYYAGVSQGQRTVVCCTFPATSCKVGIPQNVHMACKHGEGSRGR